MYMTVITIWTGLPIVILIIFVLFLRQKLRKRRAVQKFADDRISVGIFHPFCNAGGGCERVLWVALKDLQAKYPSHHFVVYTGDTNVFPEEIISNTKNRFNISLPATTDFVYLHKRKWVEESRFPYFTLVAQSLGSIYLSIEALCKFVPDIYIDTMGYAFSLPVFKYIGNCKVGCYVHCPTVSSYIYRGSSYNNRMVMHSNPIVSLVKHVYYKIFAKMYSWAGCCSDVVMVNSSWTEEHINQLWQCPANTYKVYPPCGVEEFNTIDIKDEACGPVTKILSISQFRPEKDHPLQIRTLYQLREMLREHEWNRIRLVLVGSCRNAEDEARVKDMEDLCKHLSVENNVQFKINISFEELKHELSESLIGIHTMWNEHFGIGIVESMAAGLIMVANRSGGPLMDIIMEYDSSRNGFLAIDENDYAESIRNILLMTPESRTRIRNQARASVDRFSDKQFTKSFLEAVESLFQ